MTTSQHLGRDVGAWTRIRIVAGKEFGDCLRSRWLLLGSLLFAILGLAVFFGTAAIGGTLKYQPLVTVVNSLLSLTVFLLPLLALGKQGGIKGFDVKDGAEITLELDQPVVVHADGEYCGDVRYIKFCCRRDTLWLLHPRREK